MKAAVLAEKLHPGSEKILIIVGLMGKHGHPKGQRRHQDGQAKPQRRRLQLSLDKKERAQAQKRGKQENQKNVQGHGSPSFYEVV